MLKKSWEAHRRKPIQTLLPPSLHLLISRGNLKYYMLQRVSVKMSSLGTLLYAWILLCVTPACPWPALLTYLSPCYNITHARRGLVVPWPTSHFITSSLHSNWHIVSIPIAFWMKKKMNGKTEAWINVCVGECNSFRANSLAKEVKKWSVEGTSEIIWSNPLIFQKPRNFGIVPHGIEKNISGNLQKNIRKSKHSL